MNERSFSAGVVAVLAGVVVFAALALGAVELWSVTIVQGVVFTLVLAWLWRANHYSRWNLRPGALDWVVWLGLGLAGVSWVFSIHPHDSMLGFLRLLTWAAVYFLAVNHLSGRLQVRFFVVVVVTGTVLSLLGLGQSFFGLNHWWWNSPRLLSATYVNHAHFAGFLEMAIPLAVGLLTGLEREDAESGFQLNLWRVLLAAGLVVMLAAFVLTQSRGAWIVLAVSCVAVCLALAARRSLSVPGVAVILLSLVLFVGFLGFSEDRVASRLHTITVGEESTLFKGRVEVWEQSLKMIRDYPFSGTGIGTFARAFPSYRPKGIQARFYYAHNDYLQAVTETGILVIPLLVWGIGAALKGGFGRVEGEFRLQRALRLACGTGILSLILHGLVDFNFHVPANALVFVCLTAAVTRKR